MAGVADELIAQKVEQTGTGFCDHEVRAIRGIGGFLDQAMDGLWFDVEDFGLRESHAVSCRVCGGLFKDVLWVMRKHRLACGWEITA